MSAALRAEGAEAVPGEGFVRSDSAADASGDRSDSPARAGGEPGRASDGLLARAAKGLVAAEGPARRASAEATSGSNVRNRPERLADAEAAALLRGAGSGVRPDLSRRGYRLAKRAFDVVASGAAVIVLLVPGLVLSAAICAKSPGAGPLYGQLRVGRVNADGTYRLFRMWKFRSMVPHADEMLEGLRDANEADGPLFKIKDDPRVIPGVGSFIRRHSVDELPQLLNVLAGDMSLIGPRPGLPSEAVQYDERARGRLRVKPGCGGAWQTSGRSDVGFERMVELDLEYIENRSVAQDISLVFKTAGAMLSGEGAV